MKSKKKISFPKFLQRVVLLSLAIPMVFLIIRMIVLAVRPPEVEIRSMADYALMLVECVLGLFVIELPYFLERKFRVVTPPRFYILYLVFLYCGIFLGEVTSFYYRVPHWDDLLHGISSMMLAALGFSLIMILNKDPHLLMKLSPLFVSVFAFCFAAAVGVIWEVYEYTLDSFFGMNMQKYALEGGVPLVGQEALRDTMEDILLNVSGALVISIAGYISNRLNAGWFDKWTLRLREEESALAPAQSASAAAEEEAPAIAEEAAPVPE